MDDEFTVNQISTDEYVFEEKVPKHAEKHVFFEDMIDGDYSKEELVNLIQSNKERDANTYEKTFCDV